MTTTVKLTPAQHRIMAAIADKGSVHGPGNGWSLATVRALAAGGHIVAFARVMTNYSRISGRTTCWVDWVAFPADYDGNQPGYHRMRTQVI